MEAFTAVNKHSPQQTCPHGVIVAWVGAEKQMGHVYAERGSGCASATGGGMDCEESRVVDGGDEFATNNGGDIRDVGLSKFAKFMLLVLDDGPTRETEKSEPSCTVSTSIG